MAVSRRNVLLLGGLGVAGAALGVPMTAVNAKSASALADSLMPRPFRTDFVQAPVLAPSSPDTVDPADGKTVRHYTVVEKAASALARSSSTTCARKASRFQSGPVPS